MQPGASVAVIARRHDVNANQVFHWRELFLEGPLDVAPPPAQQAPWGKKVKDDIGSRPASLEKSYEMNPEPPVAAAST